MNIQKALESAQTKLRETDIASFQLDAQLLLAHVLGKSREFLLANPEYVLTNRETTKFEQCISRRIDREPICYITNSIEFYGNNFFIDERVLAPRVETETIVENAIKSAPKHSRLIDIGTGSGAIAISIAIERPDLEIIATEISQDALDVATQNATTLIKNHNIQFIKSDLFNNVEGVYETVVTNLPYVSKDYLPQMKPEVQKEPAIALFGGVGDGLDLYRKFYQQLPSHIQAGSRIYHESDPWQHEALIKLAKSTYLTPISEDYFILGFKR